MRRGWLLCAAWWIAVGGLCVAGASRADGLLSDERFTETGYGVSLRAPAGGEPVAVPEGGAVAAWTLGEEFLLRLRITESHEAVGDIAEAVGQAWAGSWVGLTQSTPKFVQTEGRKIAERPGLIQLAELEREPPALLNPEQRRNWKSDPLFYGQASVQIDPYTLAVIEVFAPQEQKERAEALLRAAVDSVMLMRPVDLFEVRLRQLEAGRDWLAGFRRRAAFEAAEPEAWFAVSRAGRPVGYERRVVQTNPEVVRNLKFALRDPGVAVGTSSVVRQDRLRLSHWRQAYAGDAGDLETWSVESELQTLPPPRRQPFAHEPKTVRWSETGLRDGRLITLAYQHPPDQDVVREVQRAERFRGEFVDANVLFRREQKQWEIPDRLPRGLLDDAPPIPPTELYLGQAELQLVGALLPHDQEQTFAFYAYDTDTNSLSLRTFDVQPRQDGGWWVVDHPTPGTPPVRLRYGPRGRLQEVVYPNGLRGVRTSRDQLAVDWPELRRDRAR